MTLTGNPATITGTGRISGLADSVIGGSGPAGTAWTLVNEGLVSETGAGVYLFAGGSITNQADGTISGFYAVDAQNVAVTVVNAGGIAGNQTAARRVKISRL